LFSILGDHSSEKVFAIALFSRRKNRAIAFSLVMVAISFANAPRRAERSLIRNKHLRSPYSAEKNSLIAFSWAMVAISFANAP
jgi:hypothetical protein